MVGTGPGHHGARRPGTARIGAIPATLDRARELGRASDQGATRFRYASRMKSPANRQVPLLLVDVDGVISLYGFGSDARPPGRFQNVEGIGHYLSATAGAHLRRLHRHFELVWCTGWQERANEHLVQALGLPGRLPHLSFTDPPGTAARHWKLDAIEHHAGVRRP